MRNHRPLVLGWPAVLVLTCVFHAVAAEEDNTPPPAAPVEEKPAAQPEKSKDSQPPATEENKKPAIEEPRTELFVGDEPVVVDPNTTAARETSENWSSVQASLKVKLMAAMQAYKAGNFQKTVNLTREVLNVDRRNLQAAELLRNALGRQLEADQTVTLYAGDRRDAQALLEAEEQAIAPPVRLPTVRPRLPRRGEGEETVKRKKMTEKLAEPVTVDFMKADLEWVLNTLFIMTSVNIIADQAALEGKSLTLHVENLPLKEVLEFIVRNNEGIQYSITEDAVWITASEEKDLKKIMFPRVYPLHHGLVSTSSGEGGGGDSGGGGGGGAGGAKPAGGNKPGGGKGDSEPTYLETVLKWMKEAKDPQMFPDGSDYLVDKQSNQLIVFTSPAGHEAISKFLDDFDQPPIQVLIKARFLTINSDYEKSVGLNLDKLISTNFNALSTGTSSTSTSSTSTSSTSTSSTSTTATTPTVAVSGVNNLHQGFSAQLGQGALNVPGTLGPGNVFQLVGSRTNPQFQVTLSAMLNDQKTKILSEPMILAVNNKEAHINVITEYYYQDSWTASATGSVITNGIAQTTSQLIPHMTKDNIGFHLHVTPSVGRDLKTINLHIYPEISQLHGTQSVTQFESASLGEQGSTGATNLTAPEPAKDKTDFETDVGMEDNGYVIIGGLVTSTYQDQVNKVPGLGNIPILGNLFKTTSKIIQKSNLIIIIEAQIITPGGRTYYKEPQADDGDIREGGTPHAPGQVSDRTRPAAVNSALGLAGQRSAPVAPPKPAPQAKRPLPAPPADVVAQAPSPVRTAEGACATLTPRERMERLARLSQQANTAELAARAGWTLPPEEESQAPHKTAPGNPTSARGETVPLHE